MSNQPTEVFRPDAGTVAGKPSRQPRWPWLVGVFGFLLAVAAAAVQAAGVAQATALNWERGTLLAWISIGLSVVAFAVGLAAVILNRGRRWGLAAMLVAVVANPFVLTQLLVALG